ncbi:MAG: SDR family NAD(P)-dependent oxidoreductase [Candidatus Omnitrophota bacterium]
MDSELSCNGYSGWYKNKVVLVTGGTSGIGLEMVRQLVKSGATVIFCGRDPLAVDAVSRETGAEGFAVDLAAREKLMPFIASLRSRFVVDVLINNAGLGNIMHFHAADIDALLAMQAVNMDALVMLSHALLPMITRKPGGGILNVGSVASFFPTPGSAVYGATKYYVAGFTDALHEECLAFGVHVTGVYPGPTSSRFLSRATSGKKADWDKAMSPGFVAAAALSGLVVNKIRVVPGFYNKALILAARTFSIDFLLYLLRKRRSQASQKGGVL